MAAQSTEIVLESEARPEDIAHTSDRDIITGLGGLHIIGSERHESRRIDNQLRGRAEQSGATAGQAQGRVVETEVTKSPGANGAGTSLLRKRTFQTTLVPLKGCDSNPYSTPILSV